MAAPAGGRGPTQRPPLWKGLGSSTSSACATALSPAGACKDNHLAFLEPSGWPRRCTANAFEHGVPLWCSVSSRWPWNDALSLFLKEERLPEQRERDLHRVICCKDQG